MNTIAGLEQAARREHARLRLLRRSQPGMPSSPAADNAAAAVSLRCHYSRGVTEQVQTRGFMAR